MAHPPRFHHGDSTPLLAGQEQERSTVDVGRSTTVSGTHLANRIGGPGSPGPHGPRRKRRREDHRPDPMPCALCNGYGDVVNPGNGDPSRKVTDWLPPVGCPRCGQTGKDPNPS